MMTQQKVAGAVGNQGVTIYRGWVHCMQTIIKEEGVRSLWKGTIPRLVWVGASSAIWYGTYQAARQAMGKRRKLKSSAKVVVNSRTIKDDGGDVQ